jgi:hypothetical protein
MKIASDYIPQADNLSEVTDVVQAVANGAHTFAELGDAIGLVERQGRYYRRAAEILGFISRPTTNRSQLTSLGQRFVGANAQDKRTILTQAVLATRLVERIVPFLERRARTGATRAELQAFLNEVASLGGSSMAGRRVSTIVSWMVTLNLVKVVRDRIVLNPLPQNVPIVEFAHDDEPLFPQRYDLQEYERVERRTRQGVTTVLIDEAQRERAEASHRALTDLMADRLRAYGAIPKRNRLIDLAAAVNKDTYLFEMKSTTAANVRSQVRRGLSQLYEYRYLQNIEDSRLVLVIEQDFQSESAWLRDYLVQDRGILLVWDGNRRFHCPPAIRSSLPFLN